MDKAILFIQGNYQIISLIIAILALIRPELSKIWRLAKGKIIFYPAGRLEIGFSDFGPTIGINGTLCAQALDQLIVRSEIKLTRLRDNATYSYDWALFREVDYIQLQNSKIDVATAFSVIAGQSKKINIQFHDRNTLDLYKDYLIKLRVSYSKYISENKGETEDALREIFCKDNQERIEAYHKMGKYFYWQPGDYKFEISFFTGNSRNKFCYAYNFSLSEEECSQIDLNRVLLIDAALFKPPPEYNFSYVEFLK